MHDFLTRTVISLVAIAITNSAIGEIIVLAALRRRGFHWVFGNAVWADHAVRLSWHIGSVGFCTAAALLVHLRMTASPLPAPVWVSVMLIAVMPGMIVTSYVSSHIRAKLSSWALIAWRVLWFAVLCAILFRLTMS